jgi:hypothetical protein
MNGPANENLVTKATNAKFKAAVVMSVVRMEAKIN